MDKRAVIDERILLIRSRWMTQSYGFAWIIAAVFFILWPLLDRPWLELLPLLIALFMGGLYFTVRAAAAGIFSVESLSRSPVRTILAFVTGFSVYLIGRLAFGTPFAQALRSSVIWVVSFGLAMYALFATSTYLARKKEKKDR